MKLILKKRLEHGNFPILFTIYETPPQWRTIKYRSPMLSIDKSEYLYFPYLQFMFAQHTVTTFFQIFASTQPYPSPNIIFNPNLRTSCLGDDWEISEHSHEENIHQYWNSTFVINEMPTLCEYKLLSDKYKSNLFNQDIPMTEASINQISHNDT